uniref:Uncharacterized protein n=1 Tax=Panagrolaimus sp. JU765 TaxID=591449 RepID=A0AC34Q776_9BILA
MVENILAGGDATNGTVEEGLKSYVGSLSNQHYQAAAQTAKTIENQEIRIEKWKSSGNGQFGGDIKIVERKADTAPHTEDDIPSYLLGRRISIVVADANDLDFDVSKLESDGLTKISENEYSTTGLLIATIIDQTNLLISRIFSKRENFIEVRFTTECPLSNLHSLIIKQILCQEFNEKDHTLVETEPNRCTLRFFERALGNDQKKFVRTLRSALELHELASRVHAVGLQYNSGPFPTFEKHITIPRGLIH